MSSSRFSDECSQDIDARSASSSADAYRKALVSANGPVRLFSDDDAKQEYYEDLHRFGSILLPQVLSKGRGSFRYKVSFRPGEHPTVEYDDAHRGYFLSSVECEHIFSVVTDDDGHRIASIETDVHQEGMEFEFPEYLSRFQDAKAAEKERLVRSAEFEHDAADIDCSISLDTGLECS